MTKLPLIARVLMGLVFFLSGLGGLLNLFPIPPDLPENLKTFMAGMMASKYLFPLIKGTETICGLLLLSGMFVPLALVALAPVILNILMVHIFLEPSGLPLAIFLCSIEIYLSFFAEPYKHAIKSLFNRR